MQACQRPATTLQRHCTYTHPYGVGQGLGWPYRRPAAANNDRRPLRWVLEQVWASTFPAKDEERSAK